MSISIDANDALYAPSDSPARGVLLCVATTRKVALGAMAAMARTQEMRGSSCCSVRGPGRLACDGWASMVSGRFQAQTKSEYLQAQDTTREKCGR